MAAPGIRRLLIANRGEIARRVQRAARAIGITPVAVFADDDRKAPFVTEADRAVPLGPGGLATTYLSVPAIIEAAAQAGADAIHPGYGFLSEDPRLAEACTAAGITWVGPPAKAMAVMANKAQAKATVAAAGVPVLASMVVDAYDPAALGTMGREVGYPLLVKASAGGGGRGMRLVQTPGELADAVAAARREAAASFGSDEVFLETYVAGPRHVEVQVLADKHGNVVHCFDRECSVQRRHQKVVEEAPATFVPELTRRTMWHAAVAAARAVGYEGAGTVEFLVFGLECAFLEMNTRLQVEHGVTELVTGLDLVGLQLGIAAGHPLPFDQDDLGVSGHALEARLCAERPRDDYRPTPGRVLHARWPGGEGVRVDAGVETGSVVSAAYDSLVAKVMAVGEDRTTALARLRRALAGPLELDGVETNRDLLAAVLADGDFAAGRTATDFLDTHPQLVAARLDDAVRRRHAAAASLFLEHLRSAASVVSGAPPSWRNVGRATHTDRFGDGEDRVGVMVGRDRRGQSVTIVGPERAEGDRAGVTVPVRASVRADGAGSGVVDLEAGGIVIRHRVRVHGHQLAVSSPEGQSLLTLADEAGSDEAGTSPAECRAPLPGSVLAVLVAVGDRVDDGTGLVVLEAMKMEHTLRSPGPGVVQEVPVAAGQQVDVGDLLVRMAPGT